MASTIGINLRVTGHCNQGGRKYMEDAFVVAYQQTEDEKDLEYAYFGIFDGHGGREAAQFAKEHLMDNIVNQKIFWSDDDELVLRAIREGFLATHLAMWKEVSKWPKTMSGLPSTSGTTSSIAFIRRGKMYIGHVGDSKIILGTQTADKGIWQARPLTKDHKPESPAERTRIYNAGGCVMNKAGVERVVWYRPRIGHQGPIRRSTRVDHIPFLAVARSLGDLWSYNYSEGEFVVSPEPDCSMITLDPKKDRCIILASDGLWNMLSPRDAVNIVQETEFANEKLILEADQSNVNKPASNPSKLLVDRALDLWYGFKMRADNTSVVTVLLDPPGPPKREVLLRQRVMQKLRPREEPESDSSPIGVTDPEEEKSMKKLPPIPSTKLDDAQKDKKRLAASPPDVRNVILPKPVVLTPKRIVTNRTSPKKVPMKDSDETPQEDSGRPPELTPTLPQESPFKPCKDVNCSHFKCNTLRKVISLSPFAEKPSQVPRETNLINPLPQIVSSNPTVKKAELAAIGNENNGKAMNEDKVTADVTVKVLRSSQKEANNANTEAGAITKEASPCEAAKTTCAVSTKRKWADDASSISNSNPVKQLKPHNWTDVSSCRAAVTRSLCTRSSRLRTGKIKD